MFLFYIFKADDAHIIIRYASFVLQHQAHAAAQPVKIAVRPSEKQFGVMRCAQDKPVHPREEMLNRLAHDKEIFHRVEIARGEQAGNLLHIVIFLMALIKNPIVAACVIFFSERVVISRKDGLEQIRI